MHIITYNIQRLKHFKKIEEIQQLLLAQNTDVIVLTESDTRFTLKGYEIQHSQYAKYFDWNGQRRDYAETERRVSILSKHAFVKQIATFDEEIALAWQINIDGNDTIIYGTILGITGKNDFNFDHHLGRMQRDWALLAEQNNLCIAGDFNISFADNYYTKALVRSVMQEFFIKHKLMHLTAGLPQCIDHIVLSNKLLEKDVKHVKPTSVGTFGEEKVLSDHVGIRVKVG
jgi:endonuclease/exonuclease/phosphatase family metal-dependent hydrolase